MKYLIKALEGESTVIRKHVRVMTYQLVLHLTFLYKIRRKWNFCQNNIKPVYGETKPTFLMKELKLRRKWNLCQNKKYQTSVKGNETNISDERIHARSHYCFHIWILNNITFHTYGLCILFVDRIWTLQT